MDMKPTDANRMDLGRTDLNLGDAGRLAAPTAWEHGRFDAAAGPGKLLFGRMYEDAGIESRAFAPGGRVLCIASAGCTAMALAPAHEVVAVDINPVQLDYARARCAGGRGAHGVAERFMDLVRPVGALAGWRPAVLREFLAMDDPGLQLLYWRRHLDTRRFRVAVDGMFSLTALRTVYAGAFLEFLPPRLGSVMRARIERCIARHPNRSNPYARALLLGELSDAPAPPAARDIRFVHADAAGFLETAPARSFDAFALSNILDGASAAYAHRLYAAVKRAAAPGACVVLRSFRNPATPAEDDLAAEDRSMLWGVVLVSSADQL
jgi:S-adenosylmethionine:diacylglycerol 3-amino-3-carboxypropyl transferase